MAVYDIHKMGVHMPEPKEEDKKKADQAPDFIDRLKKAHGDLVEERLKGQIAGAVFGPQQAPQTQSQEPAFQIKGTLDLGAIIGNALNTIKEMPMYLKEMQQQKFDTLEKTLEGLKQRMESAGQKDSFVVYREVKTEVDSIVNEIKKGLDLGASTMATTDLPGLLQLEEKRIEREDHKFQYEKQIKDSDQRWREEMEQRRHQWEEDRADRNRRWEMEDRRWREDFELRRQALLSESERRKQTQGLFGDLVSSVMEGVDIQMAPKTVAKSTESTPALQPAIVAQASQPQGFPCEKCGSQITLEAGRAAGDKVSCPSCNTVYELQEKA